MDRPVVAIVQPFTSAAMIAPALRKAGLSPVAVLDYAVPAWGSLFSSHVPGDFDVIVNHHGDLAETTERLRALNPIGVIPGLESALHLAQDLSDALTPESSNVRELVDARRHKYLMHQTVAAAGLP